MRGMRDDFRAVSLYEVAKGIPVRNGETLIRMKEFRAAREVQTDGGFKRGFGNGCTAFLALLTFIKHV